MPLTHVPALPRTLRFCFAILLTCLGGPLFGAFGVTDLGTSYEVDSGAGLVFQVDKSSGDVTSIVFDGTEYRGPSGKGSQIGSGLGTATVSAETDGLSYVKITLQTDATNTADPGLTQYLIVRRGINTIYLATYVTAEPAVGELRWITRLSGRLIPNGPAPSSTGGGSTIESKDVFALPDGTTRSKYYGDPLTRGKVRAMDLTYCGATGPGIGCWMVFGNRESSSGGPFFRDIEHQLGGTVNTADQEIYNYMNSGHEQTESPRLNVLHGPYALVFTTGAPPTLPLDFSWMDPLGLKGWVPASGRGSVAGTVTGVPAGFQTVVGFANSTAQYWAVAQDGRYACTGMKPGTYTATLYQGELAVATGTVTVAAGATATENLTSTEATPSAIFRIGDWDGTPAGLRNADKLVAMHPSDVRMGGWLPTTFTVGTSPVSDFPALQLRGANSPTTIKFYLDTAQVTDLTLRIGITCAYNSGRPQIAVNGAWTSAIPAASTQPKSRSFTIGTWRGNNTTYTYDIPRSALVAGENTLTITPVSGSSDLSPWLSAGWVYDAVELDGPVQPPPAPTGLSVTDVTGDEADLAWTAAAGATSYTVRRAAAGAPYATIARGVTAPAFTDAGLTGATAYAYVVAADNGGGESADSAPVTATTQAVAPGKLVNLSVRATAGTDAETLIVGFALQGGRTVLLRGVGPTLTNYGVSGELADPILTLYDSERTVLATNDDWGSAADPAALAATFNAVGAFPLPADSKDAALVQALPSGTFTAQVTGKTPTAGAALAEVYDVHPTSAGALMNISARAEVGDADTLIAGFVLSGNVQKRVLIRAVGPGLAAYGVTGVLARPQLTLYRGRTPLATTQDWSTQATAPDMATAAGEVGAFPLADGSADAALLLPLGGGGYTVQVTSADGTPGVALIEVYAVP